MTEIVNVTTGDLKLDDGTVLAAHLPFWGAIQAMYDPRNGHSAITIGWH